MYPLTGEILGQAISRIKARIREVRMATYHPYSNEKFKTDLLQDLQDDLDGLGKDIKKL